MTNSLFRSVAFSMIVFGFALKALNLDRTCVNWAGIAGMDKYAGAINGCPGMALSVHSRPIAYRSTTPIKRYLTRTDTAMPSQGELFTSPTRLRSVVALISLSGTFLSVLDSGAEVKTPRKAESSFSAAHCHGSIAKTEWTLSDGNSPTPACVVGNNAMNGVLDFDANEDQSATVPFTLPGQFTGRLNVQIMWQAASTIGSVGWCVELITATDLKREGGAPLTQTARNCASDPAKKSAQHLNTALAIDVAAKGAAANGDALHLRVSRDANSSVVLDDMPGDARLIGVVIETQETPRQMSTH